MKTHDGMEAKLTRMLKQCQKEWGQICVQRKLCSVSTLIKVFSTSAVTHVLFLSNPHCGWQEEMN